MLSLNAQSAATVDAILTAQTSANFLRQSPDYRKVLFTGGTYFLL